MRAGSKDEERGGRSSCLDVGMGTEAQNNGMCSRSSISCVLFLTLEGGTIMISSSLSESEFFSSILMGWYVDLFLFSDFASDCDSTLTVRAQLVEICACFLFLFLVQQTGC